MQPPAPKQFTDEELKQQYGIHLATRLQADGEGKEAKWADIDDDEDDWAPETIEWNDGTKITLAHTENLPNPPLEQPAVSTAKEFPAETNQETGPASKQISSVGPNSTVLKVGSAAGAQPKLGGLVLKGPSEKPTLVAKPTVPTIVKSPWAALPPVDKVPPVPINPPQQQPSAPRFSQRDPHGFESMPPPPSPAKEIAADDFNRSWRDHHAGNLRELFNSQSGRYEPVNDARRGSLRNEQNFRAPSLLQRPLQGDQQGPAEPSAAFQTSRSGTTQDGGSWSRRRTSSSVSGGSGSFGRRMSFGKGQELASIASENLQQRRGSQPSGTLDGIAPPHNAAAPVADHSQQQHPARGYPLNAVPTTPRYKWVMTEHQQNPEHPTEAGATQTEQGSVGPFASETQDPVAMQKQLMRERRELAVKRKQEEETAEAEKMERLKAKIESLGLAPVDEKKEKVSERKVGEGPAPDGTSASIQSPPKPPVPEISGEPKQYGMMKVHHPQSVKRLSSVKEPPVEQIPEFTSSSRHISPSSGLVKPETKDIHEPPAAVDAQTAPAMVVESLRDARTENPTSSPSQEQKGQPWKNVPSGPDFYTSWGGNGMTTHTAPGGNPWGPPGGDKALGNGTFDRNLARLPQSPPVRPVSASRQKHGTVSNKMATQGWNNFAATAEAKERKQDRERERERAQEEADKAFVALIQSKAANDVVTKAITQGWKSFAATAEAEEREQDAKARAARLEAEAATTVARKTTTSNWNNTPAVAARVKAGERERERDTKERATRLEAKATTTVTRKTATQGWNNFAATAAQEEAKERKRERDRAQDEADKEFAALYRAKFAIGTVATEISQESPRAFVEVWRQTKEGNSGERKKTTPTATVNGQSSGDQQESLQAGRSATADNVLGTPQVNSAIPSATGPGRGSRFFPQVDDTIITQGAPSVGPSPGYIRPASPPPPDSVDHPAYAGDRNHPMVHLPYIKPKPTVKLPPATLAPIAPESFPPVPTPAQPLRQVPQPLVNTASWQDRFNGLFGRKASREKKHALAVNSATKIPLEVAPDHVPAAVSLPPSEDGDHTPRTLEGRDIASKTMEDEEALFEEREFGSLPTVRLPRHAPAAVWKPAKAPSMQRPRSKLFRATQVVSVEALEWSLQDKENQRPEGFLVAVRLPGGNLTTAKIMTRCNGVSYVPRTQRTPFTNLKPRRGGKPKDGFGNLGSAKGGQRSLPPPPQSGSPRPGFNNGTWAGRVSGVVH